MRADETPAAELWTLTIKQIPSKIGRLAYHYERRDANTGLYIHFGFEQRFSSRKVDSTIRHFHRNVLKDWLCLSVEEQKDDLLAYLNSLDGDRKTILANWKNFPPFMNWLPVEARAADRELFRADIEIALELLTRNLDDASTNRSA